MLLIFVASTLAHAQNDIDPYAETGGFNIKKEPVKIKVKPSEINVLSGVNATTSANLERNVKNYMYLWTHTIGAGPYNFEWYAKAAKAGSYDVTGIVAGEDAKLTLSCNEKQQTEIEAEKDWSRIPLGTIKLKKGINKIKIEIEASKIVKLSGIELTQAKAKEKLLADALQVRQNANWFKDAGYGLMFQWTNRATPETGDAIKNWEDKVNDFDVERFADMVEKTGAAYVIWSITWGQQYISAPIKSLDKLIEGRTTKRDLLGEMADRLHAKGVKLIFYYHYGYDCYHSKDSTWLQAAGGYNEDKTELYQNISDVIGEVGNRYGNKLNGWFFDGGRRYYDSHFDGSTNGILSASFKNASQAARSGNDQRIIAYNSWILPRSTEFQDYYAGEGLKQFSDLDNGVFVNGKHKGLMAHSCFPLEKRWGHIDWNTAIASPKYSPEQLIERIKHAQKNRYPLSINLEMYEDGSVSSESLELLEEVREVIRGN
jgi:hypothetical protein